MTTGAARYLIRSLPFLLAGMAVVSAPAEAVLTDTYYEQTKVSECANGTQCDIIYNRVPAGKVIYIDRVACDIRSDVSLVWSSLYVVEPDGMISSKRYTPLKMTEGPVVAGSQTTFIDMQPGMRFVAGSKPRLTLQTPVESSWFARCQLIGRVATQ